MLLDELRKAVIRETLDAHVVRFFDTNATGGEFLKRLRRRSSYIAIIGTSGNHKMDSNGREEIQ